MTPDPNTLATFLRTSKEKYIDAVKAKTAREWTVVMGNEAGDLDSIASAVAYAWVETEINKKQTIPLVQMTRDDFRLRAENLHALSLAGLDTTSLAPARELLSIDDIPVVDKGFPSNKFALVDHNVILPHFFQHNQEPEVVAIIDHHADEKQFKDADPRVIKEGGSCASLVTEVMSPAYLPAELATLLLCAILIDTDGLKPGGKAREVDFRAADFLAPLSTFAPSIPPKFLEDNLRDSPAIKDLVKELAEKKADVSSLSTLDLLRRDYKQYRFKLPWALSPTSINAGLSTVPLGLGEWIWQKKLSFHDETMLAKGKNAKHKREVVWVIQEGAEDLEELNDLRDVEDPWEMPKALDTDELAQRLWTGMEENKELELSRTEWAKFGVPEDVEIPETIRARVYKQKNAHATRKTTAPVLRSLMEESMD